MHLRGGDKMTTRGCLKCGFKLFTNNPEGDFCLDCVSLMLTDLKAQLEDLAKRPLHLQDRLRHEPEKLPMRVLRVENL